VGADNADGPPRRPEWARRDDFDGHRTNPFAHGEMINRIMQENVTIRERFENRLSALERFRAQATLLGGIGLVVLGSVTGVVVTRLLLQPLH
jgi:hypothetical protein